MTKSSVDARLRRRETPPEGGPEMQKQLVSYIRAGYPVLYILTAEEARAEMEVLGAAKELKRGLKVWSNTDGFFGPDNKPIAAVEDPIEALIAVKTGGETSTIFVMRDLPAFFREAKVQRLIRDVAREFKQGGKRTLVIISPIKNIPPELERDVTLVEFALPGKDDLQKVFTAVVEGNDTKKFIGETDETEKDLIIQACMGLTTIEAENALSKALVDKVRGGSTDKISKLVMSEKAETVKKTGILEYFDVVTTTGDIGGLENLKLWLEIRKNAFTRKAREFGLPMPRGYLLVGLPGCGKSLSAKATADILGVPLIRFDIGRVFGGIVGQSEANMRLAIQTIEAIGNCVVWIDEMEKAFAGAGGSGNLDSGVTQRVFGTFITWMQEKKAPCFIVATVNRIESLPPELLRKGRFDEIFFVDLPTAREREEILKIHVAKRGRDPKKSNFKDCVKNSEGFSGAELEEAVITGLYAAFYKEKDLTDFHIQAAIETTTPLSKSKADSLKAMAQWAANNAVNASKPEGKKESAGRQLELN